MRPTGNPGGQEWPVQIVLGGLALTFFVAAVVMALLKIDPIGFICVAIGGVLAVVALVLEYRHRQAVSNGHEPVFPESGTFGARRSRQTHTKF